MPWGEDGDAGTGTGLPAGPPGCARAVTRGLGTAGAHILPVTVLMVVLGDRIDQLHWAVWLLFALACLGLWLWLRRRPR